MKGEYKNIFAKQAAVEGGQVVPTSVEFAANGKPLGELCGRFCHAASVDVVAPKPTISHTVDVSPGF